MKTNACKAVNKGLALGLFCHLFAFAAIALPGTAHGQEGYKWFMTGELYDGATWIRGRGDNWSCVSFLVRGTERALLIDTGIGVGSIKEVALDLAAGLPLVVVNSHGHTDHVGGNSEFERVYIHPLDMEIAYRQSTVRSRQNYYEFFLDPDKKDDMAVLARVSSVLEELPDRPYYGVPVVDGDAFDLGGGRIIEVIHVPGHTPGGIALLDVKGRVAFVGDILFDGAAQLQFDYGATIEEFRDGLINLKSHSHRFDYMVWGHTMGERIPPKNIDDAIALCTAVMEGTDDAVFVGPWFVARPWEYKGINFRYNKERIFKTDSTSPPKMIGKEATMPFGWFHDVD